MSPRLLASLLSYMRLMRLKVGALMSFVALCSAILAAYGQIDLKLGLLIYLVGIASGGSCASFNAFLDRDIDVILPRKSKRPLACGEIKPRNAIVFGFFLLLVSSLLAWALNPSCSIVVVVGVAGIVAYAVLKRRTALSVILASLTNGFVVPSLGWIAATGELNMAAITVMILLSFWTLNHLILISIVHSDEYDLIKRPTVLRTYGMKSVVLLAFVSACVVFVSSVVLVYTMSLSWIYQALVLAVGAIFVAINLNLLRSLLVKDSLTAFRLSRLYILIFFLSAVLDVLVAR